MTDLKNAKMYTAVPDRPTDAGGDKHLVADACRRTSPDRCRSDHCDDVRIAIQSPPQECLGKSVYGTLSKVWFVRCSSRTEP